MIFEIWRRDRPLAATGTLMFVALAVVLFLASFDHRTVLGINVWLKPAKFLVSVGLYVWTLAWFMPYVTGPSLLKRLVSWGVSAAMTLENALIVMQGARGVRSHFNVDTRFDASVFELMGVFIAINTLLLAVFFVLLLTRASGALPRPYLWAVRIGTALLLAGSAEGAVMLSNGAHAVGVPDGGAGLRYLNFSTEGGDLRAAHLLALHAFQLIPWFAHGLGRRTPDLDPGMQIRIVILFSAAYTALALFLFWQALSGRPIF